VIENSNVAIRTGITFARVACVCTVASSASLTIVIATTWAAAWRTGAIPSVEAWQHYHDTGNGPWNHNGEMTAYVDFVFLASVMTLASGIAMAVLVRPVGQRWLGGFASVFAVATMWYHFLLID
jgi:hypothetical protein